MKYSSMLDEVVAEATKTGKKDNSAENADKVREEPLTQEQGGLVESVDLHIVEAGENGGRNNTPIDKKTNIVELIDLVEAQPIIKESASSAPQSHSTMGKSTNSTIFPKAPTKSPVPWGIEFNEQVYPGEFWSPQTGYIGDVFSYDTETTMCDKDGNVPDYIVGSIYNGHKVYFLRRDDIAAFWNLHSTCTVFMHTAEFDLSVTAKAAGVDFTPFIKDTRILDIGIFYRLTSLARNGTIPREYNLAAITKEHLKLYLPKLASVRQDFGRFLKGGSIDYTGIPENYYKYAGSDAIATFLIGIELLLTVLDLSAMHAASDGLFSYNLQLRSSLALARMQRLGVLIDHTQVQQTEKHYQALFNQAKAVLKDYGYYPGDHGNMAAYDRIMTRIEKETGIDVPATPKGEHITQAAEGLLPLAAHPFVDAFLNMKDARKVLSTFVDKLKAIGSRIHSHYSLLTRTGRTSSSSPNFQQLPRAGGIRECFIASPGYVFISSDYSALELCTLAQLMYWKYGTSELRNLINNKVDPHRFVASMVLQKPQEQVTKDERQKGKAINFGLPGGMGAPSLVNYAKRNYRVALTIEEAELWRTKWFSLFPEIYRFMQERGSTVVVRPFGRIRANCEFTTYHNTPFQGMAADGCKLALCNLTDAGFRVVGFVHDEFLVEVPENADLKAATQQIEQIMISSMKVVCPDVRIAVESAAMYRWSKAAKAVFDAAGNILPSDDKPDYSSLLNKSPQNNP